MPTPLPIADAIREGLTLWKTWIETRQAAYERKLDQRMRKAIESARDYFLTQKDVTLDEKKRSKLLRLYESRFWNNQQ